MWLQICLPCSERCGLSILSLENPNYLQEINSELLWVYDRPTLRYKLAGKKGGSICWVRRRSKWNTIQLFPPTNRFNFKNCLFGQNNRIFSLRVKLFAYCNTCLNFTTSFRGCRFFLVYLTWRISSIYARYCTPVAACGSENKSLSFRSTFLRV